jgi:hypothetical protein
MSREDAFSFVLGLGGVPPLVVNRYAAMTAATRLVDPRNEAAMKDLVDHFLRWLKDADNDHGDRELRRGVLLNVVDSLARHGGLAGDDAADVVELLDDVYKNVA